MAFEILAGLIEGQVGVDARIGGRNLRQGADVADAVGAGRAQGPGPGQRLIGQRSADAVDVLDQLTDIVDQLAKIFDVRPKVSQIAKLADVVERAKDRFGVPTVSVAETMRGGRAFGRITRHMMR